LTRRIDEFLATRGIAPGKAGSAPRVAETTEKSTQPVSVGDKPAAFVCEEDVKQAIKHGRKIVIGDRSLITPAARDLAEQHRIFVQAGLNI
jgi:hypothetical protein